MKRSAEENKGFTLAELLIVVAIIAVLVAISIPIFTSQLEKAREATDLANVRSAYSEVLQAATAEDKTSSVYDVFSDEYIKTVSLTQKEDGWQTDSGKLDIGGVMQGSTQWQGNVRGGGTCKVVYNSIREDVTLIWDGYTVYPNYQWKVTNGSISKNNTSYNATKWPASAVPEFISAKNNSGDKLTVDGITEEQYPTLYKWLSQGGGYEIGYFITDTNGKILVDSGAKYLKTTKQSFDISTNKVDDGEDVQVAIQFFKMKSGTNHSQGSVKMTEEEARELEKIFRLDSGT